MTITQRTCATCLAFNPTPKGDDPVCWNLVSFDDKAPGPCDTCDDHMTWREDDDQTALIEQQRADCGMGAVLEVSVINQIDGLIITFREG